MLDLYGTNHDARTWDAPEEFRPVKVATNMLGRRMRYSVPDQDLRIDFARLPALPRSRFVMRGVGFLEPG